MKNSIFTLVLAAILLFTFSSFTRYKNPNRFLHRQGFEFIPSGTIQLNGELKTIQGFYMLNAEVSNAQYRKFLVDLRAGGNEEMYKNDAIDSTQWLLPNSSLQELEAQYGTHKSFADYPVVNISQSAANDYCQWLGEQFKKQGINAYVRLPLEVEWKYAARGGDPANIYAWKGEYTRNAKGLYLANYKTDKSADDGAYLTTITKSYNPNDYGLYNMCGNVAEWVQEKGSTRGGSWMSDATSIRIDAPDEYAGKTGASPFIGFRPVVVLISK